MKIDISSYKPFKIDDLFYKCDLKFKKKVFNKAFDISLEQNEVFSLPLVNAKHDNNGIMYYGKPEDFDSEEMTIDIVEDGASSTGDVYPQISRTGVLYNAYLIKCKHEINKESLIFIASVLGKCVKQFFSYDNKCTWDKVKQKYIYLPAKGNEPDWEQIDLIATNYVNKGNKLLNSNLELVNKHQSKKIDVKNFKKFKISEIFETNMVGGELKTPTGSYIKKECLIENGSTPRITVSGMNNGVVGYFDTKFDSKDYRTYSNFISVSFLGSVFYQKNTASLDMKVHCLKPLDIELNENIALYLISCLKASLRKSSYGDQISSTELAAMDIYLPANTNGKPDWSKMESYIIDIKDVATKKLNIIN